MCPSFLPLPNSPDGGAPSGKHLLLFISHNRAVSSTWVTTIRRTTGHPQQPRPDVLGGQYVLRAGGVGRCPGTANHVGLADRQPGWRIAKGWSAFSSPAIALVGRDGTLRMSP